MNERIRKLAEQALDYAETNQSAEVQQYWFKLYNEKFAELIVRECAEWVNDNLGLVDEEARKDLLRHFGVE